MKYTIVFLFLSIGISAQTTINYQYDNLQRLTKATYPTGSYIQYTYDANGNRSQEVKVQQYLSVEETKPDNGLSLYPNPFYEELNIFSKNKNISGIAMYDMSGKLLQEEKVNNQNKFSFKAQNLPSGTYLLIINTESGKESFKVIKK